MFGCLLQEPIRFKVLWVDPKEPMRSWHLLKNHLAKGRTRALETTILILHNFFVFYYGYRCLKALRKISSWFKRCKHWCSCLRVHILVWMLLQDFCDRFGYRERYNARIYQLCCTRFKVEYKRSYIFKALPVKQ